MLEDTLRFSKLGYLVTVVDLILQMAIHWEVKGIYWYCKQGKLDRVVNGQTLGLGTHLFVKVPRPQQSDLFCLRVKLPPVTTSLTTQARGNPIKCLAQGHNKQTCLLISTQTLLNAERQTGKLWIPTFKVF